MSSLFGFIFLSVDQDQTVLGKSSLFTMLNHNTDISNHRDLGIKAAVQEKLRAQFRVIHQRTDRMFAILMVLQWFFGIAVALIVSPRTWVGAQSEIHPHVMMALIGGGILTLFPVAMTVLYPGRRATRIVIACSQTLYSSLLIHLTGGRIETHFHVFGSLAFLAAYRDPWVMLPSTLIVAIDHFVRGVWWPESVFGVATASQWRWLEHAAWVVFEVVFLLVIIQQSIREMRSLARQSVLLNNALRSAEASDRLFREGFNQAAMGMAVKRLDGAYIRINDRYCEITGYGREELFKKRFQDITHPDDVPLHSAAITKLSSGEISNLEIDKRYLHRQGHEVWVRLTLSLVRDEEGAPDYLIAAAQDITQERFAQDQIAKLSLVASKTRHSVIIAGPDRRIQWVNDGFTNLTGYTAEEAIGYRPSNFLHGADTDQATKTLISQRLQDEQAVSVEIQNYHKDGHPYWINLEIDPVFDNQGHLIHFIATQSDISERIRREKELEEATEAAQAANRAKSQFLANISHEIRTPLNGILGFTEVLIRDRGKISANEMDEHLQIIRRSGEHLLTLINDVLDLSKIEAECLSVESISCSPHQVLSDTVSVLRVGAMEKGISLDYRWESAVPEFIVSDPYRLKQLLLNLVGNAIKFTDQGSVLIVASLDKAASQPELIFEIRDTGIGIPQEKLDAVFQPFTQADDTVTRKYGGTGLGLSISQKIAESLGGNLSVRSEVGRGSTFVARIATGDLSQADRYDLSDEPPGADIKSGQLSGCDFDGISVLVVDDGDTNRKLIRLLLERHGAKVRLAENGQVALDMVARNSFDVVLMDMQMPVLDGYSASTRLRERGYDRPIIALTAHAMKGDREKCERAGCSGYLAKPINADELYALMTRLCQRASIGFESVVDQLINELSDNECPPFAPIRSHLPTEDPEVWDLVDTFLSRLESKLAEMDRAWDEGDMGALSELAHWLKGAGGTVGFDCFTQPASDLEGDANSNCRTNAKATMGKIRELQRRCVVSPEL
ncbi:PAS domain S-box protein [Roseiconus lacunae]|uniref:PAS domain S-box protein n=1 Tax=Roseiconus lacunae TaxID=2605694 RepID=UPI001E2A68EA|nr:PAS domain S-box protein [Roseiconus lacunae]MCD0460095.1 PAS domain S-box protein [Roseiconus lacunae]